MINEDRVVSSTDELVSASNTSSVHRITIRGSLANVPSVRLSPDQSLYGENSGAEIRFVAGTDGLQLSSDNAVHGIRIEVTPDKRAIYNDTSVETLGHMILGDVTIVGQVQILARDKVRSGHVEVNGLDIIAADARGRSERPQGYGVCVIQGAFTLWNMHAEENVVITADLTGLSAGRIGAPVLGGGVFTVYGSRVDVVRNRGPVVTYGVNDMVLDNWGFVDRWTAEDKIASYGPSGIGFVNFGIVNEFKALAPIETFGQGLRGFNVYTGTVHHAEFDRIVTHADGAIGIQISQPIGHLVVHRGIETFGGTGDSLVKGVIVSLSAIGLSVKAGGSAREIEIDGGITTNGTGIPPIELLGAIETLRVSGGFRAAGGAHG